MSLPRFSDWRASSRRPTRLVLRSTDTASLPEPPDVQGRPRFVLLRSFRGVVSSALIAMMLVLSGGLALSGGDGGSASNGSSAQAAEPACIVYDIPDTFDKMTLSHNALERWPGMLSQNYVPTKEIDVDGPSENSVEELNPESGDTPGYAINPDKATAYEWYGTAGMVWTPYPSAMMANSCGTAMMSNPMTTLSNFMFMLVRFVGELGLKLFSWAFSFDAFTPFVDQISSFLKIMQEKLYLVYLPPLLILGGVWVAWNGLVKRRYSDGFQGILWMLGAGAFAFVFLLAPKALIEGPNKAINAISVSLLSTTVQAGSFFSEDGATVQLCKARGTTGGNADERQSNEAQRIAECALWETFIFQPWAVGQFGTGANVPISPDVDPLELTFRPGNSKTQTVALTYLDAAAVNRADMAAEEKPELDMDARNEKLRAVMRTLACDENEEDAAGAAESDCEYRDSWPMVSGDNWSGKMMTASLSFFSIITGMGPLIFLAATMIIMELMAVFLYLLAPVFLTLGIHPGFGRKIAIGWFEMLASNALKRIGTAGIIALLIILIQAVVSAAIPWILQVIMVAAIGGGVLVMRGKLLDKIGGVNFGGEQGLGGATQALTGRVRGMGNNAARRAGKGAAIAGAGVVAGQGAKTATVSGAGAMMAGTGAALMVDNLLDKKREDKMDAKDAARDQLLMDKLDQQEQSRRAEREQYAKEREEEANEKRKDREREAAERRTERDLARLRGEQEAHDRRMNAGREGVATGDWEEYDNAVRHTFNTEGVVPPANTGNADLDRVLDERAFATLAALGLAARRPGASPSSANSKDALLLQASDDDEMRKAVEAARKSGFQDWSRFDETVAGIQMAGRAVPNIQESYNPSENAHVANRLERLRGDGEMDIRQAVAPVPYEEIVERESSRQRKEERTLNNVARQGDEQRLVELVKRHADAGYDVPLVSTGNKEADDRWNQKIVSLISEAGSTIGVRDKWIDPEDAPAKDIKLQVPGQIELM